MRIFKEALDQAKADPEVENFIVDITNNGGGSLDILVAMAAMLTGENEAGITFTNMLTGQSITDYYQIDCNLDGKFDDADKIPCDLRVGVLTSSGSFSCGNLFPSVMKEKGAMILGEQSGGGCCAIQNMAAADGFPYRISSARSHLTTKEGGEIDFGVPVDVDLLEKNADGSNKMVTTPIVGPAIEEDGTINNGKEQDWESFDYSQFYDLDRLGEEMDKFYGEEALQPAA